MSGRTTKYESPQESSPPQKVDARMSGRTWRTTKYEPPQESPSQKVDARMLGRSTKKEAGEAAAAAAAEAAGPAAGSAKRVIRRHETRASGQSDVEVEEGKLINIADF
jgi:hypothetical protein